jgi:CDGSH-type Zn-finger protein
MSDLPNIECVPNGPLRVRGGATLRNAKGEALPTKDVTVLCRCGGSANKPYCDGTHRSNGFTSAKLADRTPDQIDTYRGKHITLHDNRSICAHAGRCTDGLPAAFREDKEPFVDPDGATADKMIDIVGKCPSGALSYAINGQPGGEPPRPPVIVVTPGPYAVMGNIAIDQAQNAGASRERYTLCRCGSSKNKPFCDGTHWDIGFKDEKN